MIRLVKFRDIDAKKYRDCVARSAQFRNSALPEVLGTLSTNGFDVLVDGDYEAVMPVTLSGRFGFNYVVNPKYCQQLGVFSPEDNISQNEAFLKALKDNYTVLYYAFNAHNQFESQLCGRKNYIIKSADYSTIKANYSAHRRRNVRVNEDMAAALDFSELHDLAEEAHFFKANVVGHGASAEINSYYETLMRLQARNMLKIYRLSYNRQTASLAVLQVAEKELSLLAFVNSKTLQDKNCPSIMIDKILQKEIAGRDFNFLGSSVPAVEDFFRRFGAQLYTYPVINNTRADVIKSLLWKR